uniref:Uncharacterized protein n=1 Tax=Acrobeloides nanus TaxID=290746 RepID=A0A914EAY4_9BILA
MGQFDSKSCLKESNMPSDMTQFATQVVSEVVEEHRHWGKGGQSQNTGAYLYDDQKICDDINHAFLSQYGGRWFCIAGPHAVFPELPRPAKLIYFEHSTGWKYGSQKYRIFIYSYDENGSLASEPPPVYAQKVPSS